MGGALKVIPRGGRDGVRFLGDPQQDDKQASGFLTTVVSGVARVLLAGVFIFSGLVKAIDPLGTAYKIQDYFMAAKAGWLTSWALPFSLVLNTFEVVLGAAILLGVFRKTTAWIVLGFMLVVTPFTWYIALTDPVPDCGCFGDAIILTNWETFFKNVILLAAAAWIWRRRQGGGHPRLWIHPAGALTGIAVGVLALSFYGLMYLPVVDFRPWKVGNHIPSLLQPGEPPEVERLFVYAHRKTDDTQRFTEEVIMQGAGPDPADWRFLRREERVLNPGTPAVIDNFSIHNEWGEEITDTYIHGPGLLFIVVAYDLHTASSVAFLERVRPLAEAVDTAGHPIIVLTATAFDTIAVFAERWDYPFPFYQADERALKTMIRSNPGLVLLKDGVVVGKWPHRRIPTQNQHRHD